MYLDNASTTKPLEIIREEVFIKEINNFGNPSSLHDLGLNAQKMIEKTRKNIAEYLNCDKNELVFTSGGTEANNLAILGNLDKVIGKHAITSKIEHKSVLSTFKALEDKCDIEYVKTNSTGNILIEDLKNKIKKETVFISIMHINNETGVINPIEEIGKLIKSINKDIIFHVDGVQAFGKFDISLKYIDLYSFSAHKIHGLKGSGGLYVSKGLKLNNILYGGQQENFIRPGTENTLGIKALDLALDFMSKNNKEIYNHVKKLKKEVIDFVSNEISDAEINSPLNEKFSPYILSISFKDIMAEVLLHTLESEGIYISTGSACNSKSKDISHVIESLDISDNFKKGTIRISFSKNNSINNIKIFNKKLKESILSIRKIMKRR